jgi:predicted N-acetyltransferase YhbS
MGVVRGRALLGFAHLFHPGSRLVGPSMTWTSDQAARAGGLGPMGLAPALRGRGLGLALLDRSIQYLSALGVREITVDWTGLTGFYGRLGFSTSKRYRQGEKVLK